MKPERDLLLAYDDPLQVTAAFNRNLLRRINDELGGTFDLDAVGAPGGLERRAAARGDAPGQPGPASRSASPRRTRDSSSRPASAIWTESSYKYEPQAGRRHGARGRIRGERQWIDRRRASP